MVVEVVDNWGEAVVYNENGDDYDDDDDHDDNWGDDSEY